MKRYDIDEVLFCPTGECNLRCLPCAGQWVQERLSKTAAERFLAECGRAGIKRVGFTGGEPFLAMATLLAIIRGAVKRNMLFDRIMTNGVWFRSNKHLEQSLQRTIKAGFDGEFCVSVDAFHEQDMKQVARFIKCAVAVGRRPDIVSIASIWDTRQRETKRKLVQLAGLLKARIERHSKTWAIRSDEAFVKVNAIELSPIGRVAKEKMPWDGRWFREDYCAGPGRALFVLSNGDVKPCCGYASHLADFTVGNINSDSFRKIASNAKRHRFMSTVYASGLSTIRKRLERKGFRFPGKTSNHCFFCYYIMTTVPRPLLEDCLDRPR